MNPSFHRWLLDQMDRQDEVGKLSREVQTDYRMSGMTHSEIKDYFRTRPEWMKEALYQAKIEFSEKPWKKLSV